MKNRILLFTGLLLLFCSNLSSKETDGMKKDNVSPQGSISVLSSPDLYDLTTKWSSEYCRLYPGVKIQVVKATDPKDVNFTNDKANIGFISNDYYSVVNRESLWKMVVGRDVIVPVISSKNPFLKKIYYQGISAKSLADLLKSTEKHDWGTLLKIGQTNPVNFYMVNDESSKSSMAKFMGIGYNNLKEVKVVSEAEIISIIQNDPFAIGFCKVKDIIGSNGQDMVQNINFLPIDKNGNGHLDYIERIYDDLYHFLRGVWIGKYPKALCRSIYSVSSVKPSNDIELGFLKWVLTDGQKYLIPFGYSDLVYSERQAETSSLSETPVFVKSAKEVYNIPKKALIILVSFVIFLFLMDFAGRYFRSIKKKIPDAGSIQPNVFNETSVKVPKGLFFDKSHTWAFMESNGLVKIGIDDFFQHITGTLTQIKMKNPGDKIIKGEKVFSIIQKGKQLDIYAPITGTITANNEILSTNSSLLNSSPYSDGWVYTIEPANWLRDIQFLVMADTYSNWIKKEFSRLRDFLAISLKNHQVEYAQIILQDGGELKDCVLEDLGPEVWEDFQTKFIDTFK